MTRAFIIKLQVDDTVDIAAVAEDIGDALIDAGFDIDSVAPWASHSDVPLYNPSGNPLEGLQGSLAPDVPPSIELSAFI